MAARGSDVWKYGRHIRPYPLVPHFRPVRNTRRARPLLEASETYEVVGARCSDGIGARTSPRPTELRFFLWAYQGQYGILNHRIGQI